MDEGDVGVGQWEPAAMRRAFREWGVPRELLPYTSPVYEMSHLEVPLPPRIHLPGLWTPAGPPSLQRVQEGLALGMGLEVGDLEEFDFRWLGASLMHVTSVSCPPSSRAWAGFESLADAFSLRYLSVTGGDAAADLSGLPALEFVSIQGTGLLSAARAPNVRDVMVSFDGMKPLGRLDDLVLSSSIRVLVLPCDGVDLERLLVQVPGLSSLQVSDAESVDLSVLRLVPELEELVVAGFDEVDLSSLVGLPKLRVLTLSTIRSLSGVGALRACGSLRDVQIFRVRQLDDRDALLHLELDEFSGAGGVFDAEFAKIIGSKPGNWYVEYPKTRAADGAAAGGVECWDHEWAQDFMSTAEMYRAYRVWGVPEELLPFTTDVYGTPLPPQVQLPEGWTPAGTPSLPRVREALDLGMGLVVGDIDEFDLGWLGSSLARATSVQCYLPSDAVAGLELLRGATSLRLLTGPDTEVEVDLSSLPVLETAVVQGSGLLSAARAPQVRNVKISFRDEKPRGRLDDLVLSPSVRMLNLQCDGVDLERLLIQVPGLQELALSEARSLDLAAVRRLPDLEGVFVERVGQVDISPLGGATKLRTLALNTVRNVSGVGVLRECPSLRDVDIFRVREMDDRDALLELELDEFAGVGRIFDAEFEEIIDRKSGNWYVEYPKRRSSRN